jgi:hypothetical protein
MGGEPVGDWTEVFVVLTFAGKVEPPENDHRSSLEPVTPILASCYHLSLP